MALWCTSIVGIIIIAWALREIFRDLFQPTGSGSLSSFVARWLFRLSKHAPSTMRIAGPLSIVVVIFAWTFATAAGFALIYWGRFPQSFHSAATESHEPVGRFWTVLYISLASLTTLSSGEIAPQGAGGRIITAVESLIGVSLITASVTWIVLIYPALGRMRALSRSAATLIWAQQDTGIDLLGGNVEGLLGDLADAVIRVRVDLIHFPLIYYFHADTEGTSLARSLIHLSELAERASHDKRPEQIRLGAAMLNHAIGETAALLAAKFLRQVKDKEPREIFEAMRRDHLERDKPDQEEQ